MKTDIEIIRGTTNTLNVTITDAYGQLYTLASGERVLFGVKKKHTDSEYLILKAITSGSNGIYEIPIYPADTENLECGRYIYDVSVESDNNLFNVIEASGFTVVMNITKWGAN